MNILIVIIPLAILIGVLFVIGFVWAARRGQFEDLVSPAHRILLDDLKETKKGNKK